MLVKLIVDMCVSNTDWYKNRIWNVQKSVQKKHMYYFKYLSRVGMYIRLDKNQTENQTTHTKQELSLNGKIKHV